MSTGYSGGRRHGPAEIAKAYGSTRTWPSASCAAPADPRLAAPPLSAAELGPVHTALTGLPGRIPP
ncbi:hypothetical protein ACFWXK_20985 [Streptomyces sp. NPDC059070]|uniref:hypothetical protein n=1 Tax=unclassified Streptomyces TaxID=2593676 RepID=UPI0034E1F890